MKRGFIPQPPMKIVTEDGDDAALESVRQLAAGAQSTAETAAASASNAQQMVRNRDPRLAAVEESTVTLQGLAATIDARVADSQADRQALHAGQADLQSRLDAESAARQAVDAEVQRAAADVAARLDRVQLTPGPPGKSAYELARDAGYGGTQAQWLATLKGDPGAAGKDGAAGRDGKDIDPVVASDLTKRILTLEGAVKALQSPKPFAVGIAATPAIALLQSIDVAIELSREMPDTDYTLELSRSQGLLTAGAVTFKAKTRTTVTYTLRAVVALGAGSLVVLARY